MKRLVWAALVAALAAGCGPIHIFETVFVTVVNDCKGAGLVLENIHMKPVTLSYGQSARLELERKFGDDYEQAVTARGFGPNGAYLGSTTRRFYTYGGGSYGTLRQETWEIQSLQGGKGCGRIEQ
jgi:hypothetical protein